MKKILITGTIIALLPLASFATGQTNTQQSVSMNPTMLLKLINQNVQTGNKTQANNWKQYFTIDKAKEQPKNNTQFLSATSGYQQMADDFAFTQNQALNTDPNQLPQTIYVNNGSNKTYIKQLESGQSKGNFGGFNSSNLMDYNFKLDTNFQANNQYTQNVVSGAFSSSQKSQLAPATAISNSLNAIMQTYQQQTQAQTNQKAGQQKTVTLPSQMQSLQKSVTAPFTQKYFNALAKASLPQAARLGDELMAENNLLKYQQIKQEQSKTVLQANELSQQMKSNQLLAENLKEMKVIAGELKQKK